MLPLDWRLLQLPYFEKIGDTGLKEGVQRLIRPLSEGRIILLLKY